jgi:guanosine-3',5'-bis(diphosphate) 3'-pyrophosphohydrolase
VVIKKNYNQYGTFMRSIFEVSDGKNTQTKEKLASAMNLMYFVHRDQRCRSDGEWFLLHPLRVTHRLIYGYGITDIDSIIAALLHDTIEDQASMVARLTDNHSDNVSAALDYLANSFGKRVASIVAVLTHNKAQPYIDYARMAFDNEDTRFIKLSDFEDNAFKLDNLTPELKCKYSKKYLPVLKLLNGRWHLFQNTLEADVFKRVKNQVALSIDEMQYLLELPVDEEPPWEAVGVA